MNCPNCEYPRIEYEQKRSRKKGWERTNHIARCPKCKRLFNMETGKEVVEKKGAKQPVKVKNSSAMLTTPFNTIPPDSITCSVTNTIMNKEDSCVNFEPINKNKKKRCWNCKRGGENG